MRDAIDKLFAAGHVVAASRHRLIAGCCQRQAKRCAHTVLCEDLVKQPGEDAAYCVFGGNLLDLREATKSREWHCPRGAF